MAAALAEGLAMKGHVDDGLATIDEAIAQTERRGLETFGELGVHGRVSPLEVV